MNSTVYACVSRIANDIAKMPALLKQLTTIDGVYGVWQDASPDSPFWLVLRKPNPYQTRIQFFVCWLLSLLITGNTYVLKERDGRGMVLALHILDPKKVRVYYTDRGEVFYRLSKEDLHGVFQDVNVPASEIIHDLVNPLFHPLCGVSPLYAAGLAATQANRIQQDTAQLFENHGQPSGLLITPNDVDPETAEQWSQQWKEKFTGANRGNVAILGGGLKYEKISMTLEEAQMIELLRWTTEDIARPFLVPLYKINAGPVPVSNNVEALNLQYYADTLQPRIEAIEVLLDEGLRLPSDKKVEFDLDALLRMDQVSQTTMLSEQVKGGLRKPNEGRAKLNLPPVDGGDAVYLQQQNYSLAALAKRDNSDDPFGTAKPPAPQPQLPSPDSQADEEEEQRAALDYIEKALQWAA
jgi:HK97 family phage portal protein